MNNKLVLLAVLAGFFYVCNSLAIKEGTDVYAAIKKFVNIVDKHHLNVSLILTENEYYSSGQIKKADSITVTLPVNDVVLHSATLDVKTTHDFFESVKNLNKQIDIAAELELVKVHNGEGQVTTVERTNDSLHIDSFNHDILTSVHNGHKGFYLNDSSYERWTTFVVVGQDGKNETVQVITTHVEVELLKKSATVDDKIVDTVKNVLPSIYMGTNDNTLICHRLVEALDKEFKGENFQVMYQVPDDFYVASKEWLLFDVVGTNLLIFNLSQ